MTSNRYPQVMRWFHWVMSILILGMICLGWYMSGLDGTNTLRPSLYFFHKSLGVTIFILVVARLITRHIFKAPKLPNSISPTIRLLAHLSHILLYILMVIVPFSGYIMSNPRGVPFFGLTHVPVIFSSPNQWTSFAYQVHSILAYTLLALICIHVLAVIRHQMDKNPLNRVWQRMKP